MKAPKESQDDYRFNSSLYDCLGVVEFDLPRLDLVEDLLCRAEERLLDVLRGLRGRLHERQAVVAGERLALLTRHLALVRQVSLVANQHHSDVLTALTAQHRYYHHQQQMKRKGMLKVRNEKEKEK